MKIISIVSAVVVGGMLAGCATSQMKSTPFYTGVSAYTGNVEDRVNLWPFAYYREPALSVLWPFFSLTDDHLAVRPVYSQYRQGGKNAPYDEFNFLWPLCQFDTRYHENRIFPMFWDNDSFAAFPFVWWRRGRYFNVFPLWWSNNERDLLLPLYYCDDHQFTTPLFGWDDDSSWAFPLYYHDADNFLTLAYARGHENGKDYWALPPLLSWSATSEEATSRRYLLGLAGTDDGPEDVSRQWAFPFFYHDTDTFVTPLFGWNKDASWCAPLYYKDKDCFASLPFVSGGPDDKSYWAAPLLLSYGETSETSSYNAFLLGLGGTSEGPDNTFSQWALPFFYRSETSLMTPLFGYDNERNGSWVFPCYYRDDDTFLSMAYWRKWSDGADGKRTLVHGTFPFWYADDEWFASPFWISRDAGEYGWVVPPALSWGKESATESEKFFLLGLGGYARAQEGKFADWILPLYYRDDGNFVSLPWCRWGSGEACGYAIPPLLTYFNDWGDVFTPLFGRTGGTSWALPLYYNDSDTFLSLPWCAWGDEKKREYLIPPLLAYFNSDGDFFTPLGGKFGDANWTLPLWWRDEDSFVTLLYGQNRASYGMEYVIPPLLSGWVRNNDGLSAVYALLGLGGWKNEYGINKSWLLPLWYAAGDDFISVPLIHREDYTSVCLIAGVHHGERKSGAWLWPLVGWKNDAKMSEAEAMLNADKLDAKVTVSWRGEVHNGHTNQYDHVEGAVGANDNAWLLSGLGGGDRWIAWHAEGKAADGKIVGTEHWDYGNVLAFKREGSRRVAFDAETHGKVGETVWEESGVFCNLLWHSEYDNNGKGHEYSKKSILWRFWHYENENGDVSVDSFPFFTYDAKTNGYAKTSLLWRLFRYESKPEAGTSVDVLFLPVWR